MQTDKKAPAVDVTGRNEKKLIRAADLAAFEAEHRERGNTVRVLAYVADEAKKETESLRAELDRLSKRAARLSASVVAFGSSAVALGVVAVLSSAERGGAPAWWIPPALGLAYLASGLALYGRGVLDMALRKGKDRDGNDLPDPGPQKPAAARSGGT
jgi:hypothetical protein